MTRVGVLRPTVAGGAVAEHWDCFQPIPDESVANYFDGLPGAGPALERAARRPAVRQHGRMEGDDDLRTKRGLVVPAEALAWSFARSGGAGGQHVNKTSSKATLVVATAALTGAPRLVERVRAALGDEVRVTSQTNRSQWRNRQECLELVAQLIDDAARDPAPPRRPTRPSRGAVERRIAGKRRTSELKRGRRPPLD